MNYYDAYVDLFSSRRKQQNASSHARNSLRRTALFAKALGNPQKLYSCILVAGTNGKGSTSSTLASIFREAGLRVGLYTSPHLIDVRDRIQSSSRDGKSFVRISKADFADVYERVEACAIRMVNSGALRRLPGVFEMMTLMAYVYYADIAVDVAVIEVGVGGRLDVTNIADPCISVITDIGLDHVEWLGPTVSHIAREKSGILRANGCLVTLPQTPEIDSVLRSAAIQLGAPHFDASTFLPEVHSSDPPYGQLDGGYRLDGAGRWIEVRSPLKGEHQKRNIALAIQAYMCFMEQRGMAPDASIIERGIASTKWPGRLEVMRVGKREYWLDVAHNPHGIEALCKAVSNAGIDRPSILLFSGLGDKDLHSMVRMIAEQFTREDDRVIIAPLKSKRAGSTSMLIRYFQEFGIDPILCLSVGKAIDHIHAEYPAETNVLCAGSTVLIAEARMKILGMARRFRRDARKGRKSYMMDNLAKHESVVA